MYYLCTVGLILECNKEISAGYLSKNVKTNHEENEETQGNFLLLTKLKPKVFLCCDDILKLTH